MGADSWDHSNTYSCKRGRASEKKKTLLPLDIQGLLDHQATTVSVNGFRNEMAGLVRDIRAIPYERPKRVFASLAAVLCFFLLAMFGYIGWLYREELSQLIFAKDVPEQQAPVPSSEWALVGFLTPVRQVFF